MATDINPHAIFCARGKGLDVVQSDLCSGIRGTFDLIIFNPPYLPTQPDERIDDWLEYALDGGATGRAVIGRFADTVRGVLAPKGRILLLVSSLTGLAEVVELFAGRGFTAEVAQQQTVEDEELVRAPDHKNGRLTFQPVDQYNDIDGKDQADHRESRKEPGTAHKQKCSPKEPDAGYQVEKDQLAEIFHRYSLYCMPGFVVSVLF